MATHKKTVLGDRLPRLEDPPLIQGRGRFAGDINFPNQLHMRILRAPFAHAEILNIDTEAAKAVPGVVAVWTAQDIADLPPIDFRADRSAEALRVAGPRSSPLFGRNQRVLGTRNHQVGRALGSGFAGGPYGVSTVGKAMDQSVAKRRRLTGRRHAAVQEV